MMQENETSTSDQPESRLPNALSALRHPQFRWLFTSNMAYFFGMMAQFAVRAVLAWELTGSPMALSYVSLAIGVPMLLFAPFGGVIADRVERRNLIIVGQVIILTAECSVVALLISGRLTFPLLLFATALMGCVFPAISSARQAIVANIVGQRGLPNALALSMGGLNLAKVLGPAAVGLLIPTWGMVPTYLSSLLLYSLGLLAMFGVHRVPQSARPKRSALGEIADGARYIAAHRPLRAALLLGLLPTCVAMPFMALLIVFAETVWEVGTQGFGTLQATAGLGGVLGTFMVAHLGSSNRRQAIMWASLIGLGVFLASFALSPSFLLALPLLLLVGTFASVFLTLNNIVVQLLVSDAVRGRVSSVMLMSISLTPLGTVPLAAIAEAYGAPLAVCCASLLLIVLCALVYAMSPTLRGMDTEISLHLKKSAENESLD